MTYREAARKLGALDCRELPRNGSGSHWKWHSPATNRRTMLPGWGSKDHKTGTLRGAVRQLGLDWGAFDAA